MKGITLPRGGGKTTSLIKLSAENDGYIVCSTQNECSRIFAEAIDLGIRINFPITYEEFIFKRYGKIKAFYIDNVESLLEYLAHGTVLGFTISSELFEADLNK